MDAAFARRVSRTGSSISAYTTTTTKVGFGANTLTNIPSFRHEQDLNPGGSRIEIYETISHVSTNQVWLHINSASSRVYFRPIALFFSFVGSGWRGPTCQKLPVPRILPPLPSPLSSIAAHPPFPAPRQPPFLLPYSPYTWHAHYSPTLSLILRSLEIVSLNHPQLPAGTEAPF